MRIEDSNSGAGGEIRSIRRVGNQKNQVVELLRREGKAYGISGEISKILEFIQRRTGDLL
jgi:hypothetical protein